LRAIRSLSQAGVPVGVMVAPVIPVLTDSEVERILEAAAAAGARYAGYVLLRLPHEVKDLFREWLTTHEPLKAQHVMSRMQAMRGGVDYDSAWGMRQKGQGEYAQLLSMRFQAACRRYGLRTGEPFIHNTRLFQRPTLGPHQFELI
jgi:DNA repair photolyase